MSSSPSRASNRVLVPPAKPDAGECQEASPFAYGEAVAAPGQRNFSLVETGMPGGGELAASDLAARAAEREAQLREQGRQLGAQEVRASYELQLAGERAAVAQALQDFARERAAYYQKLEEETVRLALSIARKVIHREAQADPLLLMGIVRVALEKIEGATGVTLAINPQKAADWRRYLAARLGADTGSLPESMPEIVEDAALGPEQCALRTSMGSADLSLELQLKEIEQGLMDLLAARPGEKREGKQREKQGEKL